MCLNWKRKRKAQAKPLHIQVHSDAMPKQCETLISPLKKQALKLSSWPWIHSLNWNKHAVTGCTNQYLSVNVLVVGNPVPGTHTNVPGHTSLVMRSAIPVLLHNSLWAWIALTLQQTLPNHKPQFGALTLHKQTGPWSWTALGTG